MSNFSMLYRYLLEKETPYDHWDHVFLDINEEACENTWARLNHPIDSDIVELIDTRYAQPISSLVDLKHMHSLPTIGDVIVREYEIEPPF